MKKSKSVRKYKLPKGHVLVLRTSNANMTTYGWFLWPAKGPVTCPDWDPQPKCGNGLHGLFWGEGDGSLVDHSDGAKWLVVEVKESELVSLDGGAKVKFPRGKVVFAGDVLAATAMVAEHSAKARSVVGSTLTGGVGSTLTGGDRSTLTGGYRSTAKTGDLGIIAIKHWDDKAGRHRLSVGYVGEDGIEPNTFYRCNDAGKLVKA